MIVSSLTFLERLEAERLTEDNGFGLPPRMRMRSMLAVGYGRRRDRGGLPQS